VLIILNDMFDFIIEIVFAIAIGVVLFSLVSLPFIIMG